jgi:hypothetical protein
MEFARDRALKLRPMRAKQIVAVIVLVVVALLIVVPPLLNGGVKMTLSSTTSANVEHLYVTIGEVSARRADFSGTSAWQSISNKSTVVDLAFVNMTETVALGNLPLGQYDTVRVRVTNATVIINGTSQKVQLESRLFSVSVPFLTQFGTNTLIALKVSPEIEKTTDGVNLNLSFTCVSPNPSP